MSLFAIERSFGGRPDALFALRRSARLASEDVLWQRSFLIGEENSAVCIWQAPSIEALTKRARYDLAAGAPAPTRGGDHAAQLRARNVPNGGRATLLRVSPIPARAHNN